MGLTAHAIGKRIAIAVFAITLASFTTKGLWIMVYSKSALRKSPLLFIEKAIFVLLKFIVYNKFKFKVGMNHHMPFPGRPFACQKRADAIGVTRNILEFAQFLKSQCGSNSTTNRPPR